jgi:hypothetical protein
MTISISVAPPSSGDVEPPKHIVDPYSVLANIKMALLRRRLLLAPRGHASYVRNIRFWGKSGHFQGQTIHRIRRNMTK